MGATETFTGIFNESTNPFVVEKASGVLFRLERIGLTVNKKYKTKVPTIDLAIPTHPNPAQRQQL